MLKSDWEVEKLEGEKILAISKKLLMNLEKFASRLGLHYCPAG